MAHFINTWVQFFKDKMRGLEGAVKAVRSQSEVISVRAMQYRDLVLASDFSSLNAIDRLSILLGFWGVLRIAFYMISTPGGVVGRIPIWGAALSLFLGLIYTQSSEYSFLETANRKLSKDLIAYTSSLLFVVWVVGKSFKVFVQNFMGTNALLDFSLDLLLVSVGLSLFYFFLSTHLRGETLLQQKTLQRLLSLFVRLLHAFVSGITRAGNAAVQLFVKQKIGVVILLSSSIFWVYLLSVVRYIPGLELLVGLFAVTSVVIAVIGFMIVVARAISLELPKAYYQVLGSHKVADDSVVSQVKSQKRKASKKK